MSTDPWNTRDDDELIESLYQRIDKLEADSAAAFGQIDELAELRAYKESTEAGLIELSNATYPVTTGAEMWLLGKFGELMAKLGLYREPQQAEKAEGEQ